MAWIAISDHREGFFNPDGLNSNPSSASIDDDSLLSRGSLMVETRLSPDGRPQTLLEFNRMHPWHSILSLQAVPNGGIVLVISQGDDAFHTALKHEAPVRTDVLRITFNWDAPKRWGRISFEWPGFENVISMDLGNTKPIPLSDIQAMTMQPAQRRLDPDVMFFAFSDDIETVGPNAALYSDVPILTPGGYRPVNHLKRGDTVETLETGVVPVLHPVVRTVPARGSFQPVRLRAPYFGLRQDIVVAPEQRLVIRGSDVEYLFGQEAVLVPARHLVNGVSAMMYEGLKTVQYHQLVLPGHEAVISAGCPIESLYVGRLRRKPEQLERSLLAGIDRSLLPEHPVSAYSVLKPFEAITLAQQRAA